MVGGRQILNKIFFSVNAHFTVGGYFNKQNCRILDSEDPQVIEGKSHYLAEIPPNFCQKTDVNYLKRM